jgi:hypothetical protein
MRICFAISQVFWNKLFEYFKLVEIAILGVMGGVEHECTVSTLNFMKPKLRNRLTTCLDMVVRMYVQEFDKIRISHFILPLFDEGSLWLEL